MGRWGILLLCRFPVHARVRLLLLRLASADGDDPVCSLQLYTEGLCLQRAILQTHTQVLLLDPSTAWLWVPNVFHPLQSLK